jgi:hypothetical protein
MCRPSTSMDAAAAMAQIVELLGALEKIHKEHI